MSYDNTFGGHSLAPLRYQGMGGVYALGLRSDGMAELQRELQRLGYLMPGSGPYGADGRFGPRTATALRGAARYVGWTQDAYSPSGAAEAHSGEVTVPDALLNRLRSASPDPSAPYESARDEGRLPSAASMPGSGASSRMSKRRMWLVGGAAGALVLGGLWWRSRKSDRATGAALS